METNQISQGTKNLIHAIPVSEIGSAIAELIKELCKKVDAKDAAKILIGALGVAGVTKIVKDVLKAM